VCKRGEKENEGREYLEILFIHFHRIGSFSLILSKIFESSINSGGCSIERWYKLVPTNDATSAIKHYGSYWGFDHDISSMELCLRFITFV
jgi:hypothetical protein